MRLSPAYRVVSLLLGGLVTLSVPGSAVAHGYAHHEETHERQAHGHEHQSQPVDDDHGTDAWVISALGSDHDGRAHGHISLDQGLASRIDVPVFALPATASGLWTVIVVETAALASLTDAPPRSGPPPASPRQPRAPPLG